MIPNLSPDDSKHFFVHINGMSCKCPGIYLELLAVVLYQTKIAVISPFKKKNFNNL